MSVRPVTFAGYARHLRQIVGDIIAAKVSRKAKARQRRTTRAAIDSTSLSVITPEAVQAWRLGFLARAQGDATREQSAKTSCNSIIRQARSLFAPKVVQFLGSLRLPQQASNSFHSLHQSHQTPEDCFARHSESW
jgi:hypothetical protein